MTPTASLMAKAMLDIIKARPGASFPELMRELDVAGYPAAGTFSLEPLPNMLMWAGMSEDFCDALSALRRGGQVHLHVLANQMEAVLVHSADGGILNLPFAARPPAEGYREPHWSPVVWYAGSGCSAKNCVPSPVRAA